MSVSSSQSASHSYSGLFTSLYVDGAFECLSHVPVRLPWGYRRPAYTRPNSDTVRLTSTTSNVVWRPLPREPPWISARTLYFQKLDSWTYSVGLSLLFFTQLFLTFKRSDSRSAGRKRIFNEIATQGHSRSFILHSFAGRQGVAYRHIILLAVSLTFSKT